MSQTRAGCVDKNVKFNIRQERNGDTLETRYLRALYAWCTPRCMLIYVTVGRCALHARMGSKDFLSMLKNFLDSRRESVVCTVTVRYMRVPI